VGSIRNKKTPDASLPSFCLHAVDAL